MGLVPVNITTSGTLKKSLAHEYRLSLKVGINGISYVIVDSVGKIMALRSYPLSGSSQVRHLKAVFSEDDHLKLKFRGTKIAIDSHLFTLIPQRLFKEKDRQLYLSPTASTKNTDCIKDNTLAFNSSKLVYACDDALASVLKNYFPSAALFHQVTALLLGWRKQAEVKEGKKVFLDVENDTLTIALFDEAELIFVNRFLYKSVEDFLYYTLLIYNRFDLRPSQTPCILSGFLEESSDIYKQLYKYIRHVIFMSPVPYYQFPKEWNDVPPHFYFDIYSLKLCE